MTKTDCGYEIDDDETGIAGIHPFPPRTDLRATIVTYCGCKPTCTAINPPADLTPYQDTTNYWDNITGLSISYPPLPNCADFKLITHHYRHRESTVPTILQNKQSAIASSVAKPNISQDPHFWLTVMQTVHDSFISSRPMDMILKLLHDALYMGEIARHYQIHVKHMYKYWPHLIIDQHCYHCHHTSNMM
jgi:hypothetical protein